MRTRGLAGTRKKGSLAPGTGAKPSSALREGPGGPSLPQPGAKGSIWGRCLSALEPVSIYSRVACFIYLWVCFSLSLLCPRIRVLCPAGRHMTAEPGLLPLPRTPAPGVMTESPPKTHTLKHAHTGACSRTLITHAHTCAHAHARRACTCVRTRSHTRSAVRALHPPPPPRLPAPSTSLASADQHSPVTHKLVSEMRVPTPNLDTQTPVCLQRKP